MCGVGGVRGAVSGAKYRLRCPCIMCERADGETRDDRPTRRQELPPSSLLLCHVSGSQERENDVSSPSSWLLTLEAGVLVVAPPDIFADAS